MIFRQLFDRESCTYTYLLGDPQSGLALLIDPVVENVDRDLQILDELGLTLHSTLDTHVHADHVTGAWELKQRTGARIAYPAGSGSTEPDCELEHGDVLQVGSIRLTTRHTPGHTACSATYVLADHSMAFTGDTLLIRGCGRTDFQGGSAEELYSSVHDQIFSLPEDCQLYPGHDYRGRTLTTVSEEKAYNTRLGNNRALPDFVAIMADLDLAYPKKIDVAVPANRQLGRPTDPWSALMRDSAGVLQAPAEWIGEHFELLRLVDVRSEDEYNGPLGHLPGSELVPFPTLGFVTRSWDHDTPIVVISRSGKRSNQAAQALENAGFGRVASLEGGMLAYALRPDAPAHAQPCAPVAEAGR